MSVSFVRPQKVILLLSKAWICYKKFTIVVLAFFWLSILCTVRRQLFIMMDLFSTYSFHMEDNQPPRESCQSQCETSDTCMLRNTHQMMSTHINMQTVTATDIQTKGGDIEPGSADSWFYSDICSVPETDGEPIRLTGASAIFHLQHHPSAPP